MRYLRSTCPVVPARSPEVSVAMHTPSGRFIGKSIVCIKTVSPFNTVSSFELFPLNTLLAVARRSIEGGAAAGGGSGAFPKGSFPERGMMQIGSTSCKAIAMTLTHRSFSFALPYELEVSLNRKKIVILCRDERHERAVALHCRHPCLYVVRKLLLYFHATTTTLMHTRFSSHIFSISFNNNFPS